MNIFRINEITDDMINLSNDRFFAFLEYALDKDACELFQIQSIRNMLSLSSVTLDELIRILNYDVQELNLLKKKLGFMTKDGHYQLRLGYRSSIERLLILIKSKNDTSQNQSSSPSVESLTDNLLAQLTMLWNERSAPNKDDFMPVLFPLIKNIVTNLNKMKNKYTYDGPVRSFALSLFILGGRNCYEFLRLNLPGALPHLTNIEALIKEKGMKLSEGEFRFDLLRNYFTINKCSFAFACEDSTSVIPRISYDVESDSFVGLSAPLNGNGTPRLKSFQTDRFDELKSWFETFSRSKSINLHVVQPLTDLVPSFILAAYGTNNKFSATDVLKRWFYIYQQSLNQGVRIIGFSTDGDPRFIRAMRLCARFFADLPNLNLLKHDDHINVNIPSGWTWFLMNSRQIFVFLQDPIHLATKLRNRLFSKVASMKIGDYCIDVKHLIQLIETKSKLEHNLIKCDVSPKDRQNFSSCIRMSSPTVLHLLGQFETAKGTCLYLSLLQLLISALIDKSCSIEERLYNIWTVAFTCRLWWAWLEHDKSKDRSRPDHSKSSKRSKIDRFISRTAFWSIELNAHTLLFLVLSVIQQKLPIDVLNTYLFSSQPCENVFRIARSLSGAYSSMTNFTVDAFIRRCEKISVINSMKSGHDANNRYRLKFPQHHKSSSRTNESLMRPMDKLHLTESDVEKIIDSAFKKAQQNAKLVHISKTLSEYNVYSLPELSRFMKDRLSATVSNVTDYTKCDYSSDDTDDENSSEENNSDSIQDDDETVFDLEDEDDPTIETDFSNIQQDNFPGCRVYDHVDPDQSFKFFRVNIGDKVKYIHKQTSCWILTNDKNRLSNDRLIRVRGL